MHGITDADREAANALREILADLSGFWYHTGDEGPLCQALARHRARAERRLIDKLMPAIRPGDAANESGEAPPPLPRDCDARRSEGPAGRLAS